MDTSTTGGPTKPFNLSELSEVLLRRDKPAVGFFISRKLWETIVARWRHEGNDPLAPVPQTFHGTRIAIDPALADTEFDVALTEDAWRDRLRALGQAGPK